jgi:hypothetical protein
VVRNVGNPKPSAYAACTPFTSFHSFTLQDYRELMFQALQRKLSVCWAVLRVNTSSLVLWLCVWLRCDLLLHAPPAGFPLWAIVIAILFYIGIVVFAFLTCIPKIQVKKPGGRTYFNKRLTLWCLTVRSSGETHVACTSLAVPPIVVKIHGAVLECIIE